MMMLTIKTEELKKKKNQSGIYKYIYLYTTQMRLVKTINASIE